MRVLTVALLLAVASHAAESLERVAARIVAVEGDQAVVGLGRDDGIRVETPGTCYAAPREGGRARYAGRARVVAADAQTARVRLEPREGVAIRPGDWIEVVAAVPARPRSALWTLVRRGATLRYADATAPVATYRGLYAAETPALVAALYARMAERVPGASAADAKSFCRYRAQDGTALVGATIVVDEALAAWIEAGRPPSDDEILERLLALDDDDAAGRAALLRTHREAVERSVARLARVRARKLARTGDPARARRHLAVARDAVALFGLVREAPRLLIAEADLSAAEDDPEGELAACKKAAQLFARLEPPDRFGEARARERAAGLCVRLQRLDAAHEAYGRALALHRATKNVSGAAHCLEWRGRIHAQRGEWPLARADLVAAIATWRDTKNKIRLADALGLLGLVAENTGAFDEAVRHYGEAAGLLREGKAARGEAWMLAELGRLHLHAGRYAEAERAYDRSIALLRERDRGELAYGLRQRGLARQRLGRRDAALADLAEAVALRRALGDPGELADTLLFEGGALVEALRLEEARERAREARALAEPLEDRRLEARARQLAGGIALAQGRYADAIPDFVRASELFAATGDPVEAARAALNLGTVHEMRGEFDAARALYREAREAAPAAVDIVMLALAGDLRVLIVRGELDEALALYERARRLPVRIPWNRVNLLAAGAELFAERGENEAAFAAFDEALALCSRLEFDHGTAFTLAKRGHERARQGDPGGAMKDYERALELHPNPEVAAEVARGATELLLFLGETDSAVAFAREGVDLARKQKGRPLLARNLLALAEAMLASAAPAADVEPVLAEAERLGAALEAPLVRAEALRLRGGLAAPAAAVRIYREGLALVAEQPARHVAWRLHFELSRALARTGDVAAAADAGRAAVRILEEMRGALGGGPAARQRFVEDRIGVYESLAELLGERIEHETDAGTRQALIDEAMELVARARFERLAGDPGGTGSERLDELLEKYRRAQRDLARQRAAQVDALAKGNRERANAIGVVLAKTEQRLGELFVDLKASDEDLGARLRFDPRRIGEAMRDAPAGATLVVYFPGRTKLFLWVFTHEGFREWRQVAIGRAELYALVKEYRDGIAEAAARVGNREPMGRGFGYAAEADDNNPPWYRGHIAAMRAVLRKLHDRLLAPIAGHVSAAEPLLILPYGQLSYLPFEALMAPDGTFVGATKRLAYFTSEHHLADALRGLRDEPRRSGDVWVAFADPRGRLASSLEEAAEIGALFERAEVHTQATGTAGEEQVLAVREDCTILHFATHGFLNGNEPSRTYLELDPRSGDGKLAQAEVWPRLKREAPPFRARNVRLVVLSACETARGADKPQAEVLGMPDAFVMAGAPTVVASLWSVYTYTTTDLMIGFYRRHVKGKQDPAGALRDARRALIEARDGRYAHPFYWAPFLLFGDWR